MAAVVGGLAIWLYCICKHHFVSSHVGFEKAIKKAMVLLGTVRFTSVFFCLLTCDHMIEL